MTATRGDGFGCCYRCRRSWRRTAYHITDYGFHGRHGLFPLCERCWTELSPAQRTPFYDLLVADWKREGSRVSVSDELDIWVSVMNGG